MPALRDAFSKAVGGDAASKPDGAHSSAQQKYMLRVTAGPSYDVSTHKPLPVNAPDAVQLSNRFMDVKVKMRVREYAGLPRDSRTTSPYFDDPVHAKDQYSIGFSFVPKVDIPAADTVWGNDLDHPVRDRLPPMFNTAFDIVKRFIDPGLSHDAYADEPWLLGPALSCWFAFRVGELVRQPWLFPQPEEKSVMKEGADGSGADVRKKLGLPADGEKRRKFFLDEKNRSNFTFEQGRLYQADFYNPYLDFNNLALKLPGFSLSVLRYINDKTHTLRYVFKNKKTGDLYFVVVLTLLFGNDLKKALLEEDGQTSAGQANPDDVD